MRIYLDHARKEKDTIKMANAYFHLGKVSKIKEGLIFADSIINLTSKLNHKTYPARGYHEKATIYHKIGELKIATKYYTDAYKLALKNKNLS